MDPSGTSYSHYNSAVSLRIFKEPVELECKIRGASHHELTETVLKEKCLLERQDEAVLLLNMEEDLPEINLTEEEEGEEGEDEQDGVDTDKQEKILGRLAEILDGHILPVAALDVAEHLGIGADVGHRETDEVGQGQDQPRHLGQDQHLSLVEE